MPYTLCSNEGELASTMTPEIYKTKYLPLEPPFIINLKDCQRKNIFEDELKKYGLGVFHNELGIQLFKLDTGKILDAEAEYRPPPIILKVTSE